MTDKKEKLLTLAGKIVDRASLDWDFEEKSKDLTAEMEKLKIVDAIANAFQSVMDETKEPERITPDPPFNWGHLNVLECIGQGSFGQVFRANDPILQRDVALKLRRTLAHAGHDNQQYIQEARRLARVRHPNVLAIHGADIHQEYVGLWADLIEGETLQKIWDDQGTVPWKQALEIGLAVGRGLEAVHRAGLVHGDIKGSNVMIEQTGRVILMDFGSGSEISDRFQEKAKQPFSGTPLYMAPEMFDEAIHTPASDQYALGTLMYRMISGTYPVKGMTIPEIIYNRENEPIKDLKSLCPGLPRELSRLVDQLLERNPQKRPDASAFCQSIRWIQKKPIRRKKRLVLATIISALFVSSVFSTFGFVKARQAVERERTAKLRIESINQFLTDMLKSPTPMQKGKDIRMVELLEAAQENVIRAFPGQPSVQADLYYTLGVTYRQLGDMEKSKSLLWKSTQMFRELNISPNPSLYRTMVALAEAYIINREYQEAEPLLREVLKQESLLEGSGFFWKAKARLGEVLDTKGEFKEAESYYQQVLHSPKALNSLTDYQQLVMLNLGNLWTNQGKYAESEHILMELIHFYQNHGQDEHPNNIAAKGTVFVSLIYQGKLKEAVPFARESMESSIKLHGERHPNSIASTANLGMVLSDMGEYVEAKKYTGRAHDLALEKWGEKNLNTLQIMAYHAKVLSQLGDLKQAESMLRQADHYLFEVVGDKHPAALTNRIDLARILCQMGKAEESESLTLDVLDTMKTVFGAEHLVTLNAREVLDASRSQQGLYLEAEQDLRAVLATKQTSLGAENPETLDTLHTLAETLVRAGKNEEALKEYQRVVQGRAKVLGPNHAKSRQAARDWLQASQTSSQIEGVKNALKKLGVSPVMESYP